MRYGCVGKQLHKGHDRKANCGKDHHISFAHFLIKRALRACRNQGIVEQHIADGQHKGAVLPADGIITNPQIHIDIAAHTDGNRENRDNPEIFIGQKLLCCPR